ncbi:MAG: DUF5722 domain-containing protein, partial [Oscillospiraceae bacterium]|nr:DUF5722 domain-containing protein [Oscillospiraceae bacterium]
MNQSTLQAKNRLISAILMIAVLFGTVFVFSNMRISAESEPEPEATGEPTQIVSALAYVEKKENEITQILPVESREDMALGPNSVFIRIQVYVSPVDATKYYGSSIYIFKLTPNEEITDVADKQPETSFDVNSSEGFSYNSTLLAPNLSNLASGEIFYKFVAAVKEDDRFLPISDACYIGNIGWLSNKKETPPASKTKKGLSVQIFGEARLLGVGYTKINMFINDFMASEPSANTETYIYGGEEFYFNIDKISEYDKKIKYFTNEGINVTAALLISAKSYELPLPEIAGDAEDQSEGGEALEGSESQQRFEPIDYLIHPAALASAKAGEGNPFFYGINTTDEIGVKYFEALMSFIADRYVKEGGVYGRIYNIVLGNDIGRTSSYNYCGKMIDIVSYVKDYMRALRICDTALRSRFGGARVYVPFDNWFATKPLGDGDFVNKQIIDLLCEYSAKEGNFIWNVAIKAYNASPTNPECWKEIEPINDFSTPVITMKNIEVLCNYLNLEKKEYLPSGELRKVMLYDQGFSSGDNSKENQELQAAAFVYAYLKAKYTPDVTAFIYHGHVDSKTEVGSLGLWTNAPDTENEPGEKKRIYEVFKYMDTNRETEKIAFAKSIIGIEDFSEIAKLYSPNGEPAVALFEIAGESLKKTPNQTNIGLFNDARLAGFIGSLNISKMGMVKYENPDSEEFDGKSMLFAEFSSPTKGDYGGIMKIYGPDEPVLNLENERYVGVKLRIDTDAAIPGDQKIQLILVLESEPAAFAQATGEGGGSATQSADVTAKPSLVFEGLANISVGKDEAVFFDISGWEGRGDIKKIKLLANPYYAPAGQNAGQDKIYEFTMYVMSIVSAHYSGMSVLQTIVVIFMVLIFVAVGGYVALYIRAKIIRKKRREQRELRRKRAMAAAARTGANPQNPGMTQNPRPQRPPGAPPPQRTQRNQNQRP